MPLPCELPLSSSPGNPASLPGAIAALSAQVTSTMLEVRQEIGELKCEFVRVRGLAIQLATSLINEQTQRLKLGFANIKNAELEDINQQAIIENQQEVICSLATSIVFDKKQIFLLKVAGEVRSHQNLIGQLEDAIAIIRLQVKIIRELL